jgi:hypothetical protein
MELKPGSRWRSAVSPVEVVVVRAPTTTGVLACGGVAMVASGAPVEAAAPPAGQTLMGKRYQDEASGLEALCAKGGPGELSFDGRALTIRDAKKLPSSD